MAKKEVEAISRPLDIAHLIGKPKNHVARVGVELEGAWKVVPRDIQLEHDGSVFAGREPADHRIGEIPIGPMQPAAMPKVMRKYYPDKVNYTCGMHIHMSFENLRPYNWLMAPEYQDTLIDQLIIWAQGEGFPPDHCIWERLAGKSIFCQKKFWPDEQVANKRKDHDQQKHGHRYTIVNYCGRQNTIEIRVLPMMQTVDQAIRAIKHVIDITNACLMLLADRERFKSSLEIDANEVYVEVIEEELVLSGAQHRKMERG